MEAYCSSLKCDRGTFSTGDDIWFTGESLNMLVESDSSLVSGEFRPSSTFGSTFDSKWVILNPTNFFSTLPRANSTEAVVTTNGIIRLQFPSIDANSNRIHDWMEFDKEGVVNVSGRLTPSFKAGGYHWQRTELNGFWVKPRATNIGTLSLTAITSWKRTAISTNTLHTNQITLRIEIPFMRGGLIHDPSLTDTGMSLNLVSEGGTFGAVHAIGSVTARRRGTFLSWITNVAGSWKTPQFPLELVAVGSETNAIRYRALVIGLTYSSSDGFTNTPWRDFPNWMISVDNDHDDDANGFSNLTDAPRYPPSVYVESIVKRAGFLEVTIATMSTSSQEVWFDRSSNLTRWVPTKKALIFAGHLIGLDPNFVRDHLLPLRQKVELPIGAESEFFRLF